MAIRHLPGYFSILQVPERGWRGWTARDEGWTPGNARHKKGVVPEKTLLLCYRKHIEVVEQGQKDVPDMLESITRPSEPLKEESRRKTMKMDRFRSEITTIRVSTVWMSG